MTQLLFSLPDIRPPAELPRSLIFTGVVTFHDAVERA
jgi:hypothetical protein